MISRILRRFDKSLAGKEWRPVARILGSFISNQRGVAAVELAFVLPVLVIMLTGIAQMGLMFFVQNNMANVSQETVRLVAVGELTTGEGQTYADGKLINWGMTYTINVQQVGDDIVVDISVPLSEVAVVDYLGLFESGDMTSQSSMRAL